MADSTVVDKFNRTCTHLYDLRFPVMKGTTDFKGSFKSSLNNEESINLIEKLTLTRTDMVNTFSQLSTPDAKLAVVDNYLPNIFLLMTTLNNQDKITFDRNISFEWRGSLTSTEEYYKSSDVTYEVIMVLQTKAVLHNAVAKNLVETDPVTFLTEAGKHLLTASSIMQYLHSNLLTKWNQSFNLKVANPIELNVKVVLALALLFKAGAQSMAVTKALNNDTTPATIKARLSISVVNTIILSFNEVNYLPTATTLFPFMLTHMAVVREFYSAVTNLYLAQSHQDKHEVGIAIAFCNAAKRRLQEQVGPKHRPIDGGLPKLTGLYTINLAPAVVYLHAKIDALLKVAEQENRFIYFLVVPAQLPEWPAEASVMNPTAYEEPVYAGEPIVFEYKPPRTIMGSIFSSFRGSSDAKPATAPVAATVLSVDTPTTGPVVEAAAVQTSGSSSILVPGVPIPQPPAAIPASSSSNSSNSNNTAQLQADEAFARQLQQQLHLEESKASAPPASAPPSAYAQPQPLPYQPQSNYQLPYQPSQQYQQQYQHPPPPPPQQQYQYNPNSVPQQQQQYSGSAPVGVHHNGVNYPQI